MKTLETERLILRAFDVADTEDVFAYARNPQVGPAAGWPPHASMEESGRIVRMFIQADDVWALVDKQSGRVIGSLGLQRDSKRNHDRCRVVGYAISQDYWGKGLVPEAVMAVLAHAFSDLHLEIVSVIHFPFNTQSKRVIEKCGFQYEGILRKATRVFSGEIYDDVCYSITREDWDARQA